MHPLMIPVGLTVAIVGLFWPTQAAEDEDNGEVSKDSGKRGGSDRGGKPVPGRSKSDHGSRLVKPADPDPIPEPEVISDDQKPDSDNAPTVDLRGNQSGDNSRGESDSAPGSGEAEPVTGDNPPDTEETDNA